jgi:hypothetical protein
MALNLQAVISLDSSGFQTGANKVKSMTGELANSLKSYVMGAIGVTSVGLAFEKTMESAKELVNESKRMGISIEQLQVLKKAASGAGVEMDALATTFEKLNVFRAKALGGGAEGDKALGAAGKLGITKSMFETMNAQEILFGPLRQKILSTNPQEIAGPLRELLGRGFGPILPLLTKDLGALQKKMESLGMIMSTSTAVGLKQLDTQINSMKNILTVALAPAFLKLGEVVLRTVGFFNTVISFFKNLISDFKNHPESVFSPGQMIASAAANMDDPYKFVNQFKSAVAESMAQSSIKPADFSKLIAADNDEPTTAKVAKGHKEPEADQYTKVGRFLGNTRGLVGGAQTAMEKAAMDTAKNTKSLVDINRELSKKFDEMFRRRNAPTTQTIYPAT